MLISEVKKKTKQKIMPYVFNSSNVGILYIMCKVHHAWNVKQVQWSHPDLSFKKLQKQDVTVATTDLVQGKWEYPANV